ncbi:hypothetical protein JQ604_30740 [Bradyrhizobium jicamae]|uniref:hypothetical protein n=1 Tax=Bradyrhizobium jicamae TaxID=280332 RepID=UPI001BA9860A|nr:hypothetical protein [Bradyrhizobium jicamae]MBR0756578.1 hypothetical protein [Bradyrhizobium jicamae]
MSRTERTLARTTAGVLFLLTGASAWPAEDGKPAAEKWRPTDGLYGDPKTASEEQCPEAGILTIELAEKSVSGYEWGCKINRITDVTPTAIKLEMTCSDYNLAETLYPKDPKAEERTFKETMILSKRSDQSISVRKTVNGKFKGAAWRADFCPVELQRTYAENKVTAKREAAEKDYMRNPWRPKPGVYAAQGATFSERCANAGDAVIDLDERSVTIGADKCSVTSIRDNLDNIQVFVTCNTPPSPATVILKRGDDRTVLLQKMQNGETKDAGGPLAYCPDTAQRAYLVSRKGR